MCQTAQFLSPTDENAVSVFGSYETFASCCAPFSQPGDDGVLIPHWVVKSDSLSQDEDSLREDSHYEAPPFSRHTINLEFDDETMRPEKATEAPRNAGIDPSTMKMKQWYQTHNRVSEQKAPTGTNRASHHAREPIGDDDERLAMRNSDMLPKVPERVANPKMHGLTIAEASLHNP